MKKPLIRRVFSDTQYEWMLENFPFKLMYVRRWIDTQHQMWFPRWGYTERQMKESEEKAKELYDKIKWE